MSITKDDLEKASVELHDYFQKLGGPSTWHNSKVLQGHDGRFLRIEKRIKDSSRTEENSTVKEIEVVEEDDEIVRPEVSEKVEVSVIYDIIHSPSYQVPVLYVTFKSHGNNPTSHHGLPSLDKVYELLSPISFQPQMEAIGVMGALSMTDHPTTGLPAYFVHPCRTAEAMRDVIQDRAFSPREYLLAWVGLMGSGVGLNVPIEVADAMGKA